MGGHPSEIYESFIEHAFKDKQRKTLQNYLMKENKSKVHGKPNTI